MMDTGHMTLEQAATPCLLLDRGRLSSNGARMRARIAALGPGLRPHVKTLKSIDALRWVQDAGDGASPFRR